MATFDPTKYGATPVSQNTGFDPSIYGATPVQQKEPNLYEQIVSGAKTVGGILGGNIIGEAIGTGVGYTATKAKEAMGLVPKRTSQYYDTTMPTAGQLMGDVLKVGTSVIPTTGIAGVATKVASKLPVVSKVAKGVGLTAETGLMGYGQDVGTQLVEGKTGTEALTPGIGTAVGIATPASLKVMGKIFVEPGKEIINQFSPDAYTAMTKALKPSITYKDFVDNDI